MTTNNLQHRLTLMLQTLIVPLLLAGLAAACSELRATQSGASQNVPAQPQIVGIGSATVITVHGKIVAVDREKKLVTLENQHGKQITLEVLNPYNLAAAKVGENFIARFYEIATVRKKQPSEVIPASSLQEGIVSASPGQTPGAVVGQQVQLLATIDAINRDNGTVTLKGPDGVVETVSVNNPANLEPLQVGEEIVITLTKVVAIGLDKEPERSSSPSENLGREIKAGRELKSICLAG